MAAPSASWSVSEAQSFIYEHFLAWEGTDEDLILSFYTDDVVAEISGTRMEGKEALRDHFVRPFITAFPGNHHVVKNMIHGPNVIVVEWSFEAQYNGTFAGHLPAGARVKVSGTGVYEYDSAKRQITAARTYFDMATLLQLITGSLDDRQNVMAALQSTERSLNLIINTIPTHIYVLDTEGYVQYVNQAVMDYTGLSIEDVQQEDYRDRVIHPEDFKRVRAPRAAGLKRGVPFSTEQRVLRNDGQYRWFLVRYKPLLDEQGRIVRWYVAAFDIEDQKRAEWQLAHMARVTTLSALTASIAHEINQPIAAATTSAGACLRWLNRDQPDVQRAREAAMRIEQDGKRAADIISKLRSLYKKDLSPSRERLSINDTVSEMLMLLQSEANRHSVMMRTDLATNIPLMSADRVQIQQVLMNLMLNGMEAMSEHGGELRISTRLQGDEVIVSVSDTGVGISADKLGAIFNLFVTTKADGMGMGLPISNTIIESHGGRLWATANPGSGATFHFTLPTESEA